MKKVLIMVGAGIAALTLLAGDQLKQFLSSVNFYIESVGVPKFKGGFLEIPVFISLVNQSAFDFSIDQIMTTFYKWDNGEWANIGVNNPRPQVIELPKNQTTSIKIEPRISILQGLVTSVFSLLRQGGIKYRLGVRIKVAGRWLPEQYEEFPVGQIYNTG